MERWHILLNLGFSNTGVGVLPIQGPRLYVGGVPDEISEEQIVEHFNKWGNVVDVYFPGKKGAKRVGLPSPIYPDISCQYPSWALHCSRGRASLLVGFPGAQRKHCCVCCHAVMAGTQEDVDMAQSAMSWKNPTCGNTPIPRTWEQAYLCACAGELLLRDV